MKYFYLIATFLFLLYSCKKGSEIGKTFDCETSTFKTLETVEDVKNLFSIDLPTHWKINLYQDEVQSSIFTADTTKQLTETVLLDVTYINNKINFDDDFLLKQENENFSKNLTKIKSEHITFHKKPALLMQFKGKKGTFNYQLCNTFIKLNSSNFILAKIEVYGDSIVNQRFCKAFSLIENIKLKNELE